MDVFRRDVGGDLRVFYDCRIRPQALMPMAGDNKGSVQERVERDLVFLRGGMLIEHNVRLGSWPKRTMWFVLL